MGERKEIRHKRHALEEVVPLKLPYRLDIEVFRGCNFKCNFCPINNDSASKKEGYQSMTFDTLKKIVDDVVDMEKETNGEKIGVIYMGGFGESLLHKDFPEMVSYVKEKEICREIRLITNGSMLNPQLNQRLVDSGLDLLRISVEALSDEKYKKVCGYNIRFNNFLENISDLYQKAISGGGLKVSAKIVNETLNNQKEAERFFEIFNPITHYSFIENVEDIWPEYNFEKNDTAILIQKEKVIAATCTFPLEYMIVFANGDIGACCVDWKHATVYGNINNQNMKEAWNSKKLRDFQLAHLNGKRGTMEFCRNCNNPSMDNVDGKEKVIIEKLMKKL